MAAKWEQYLERWTNAGLIDRSTAEQVRAYEQDQDKARGLRWPIVIAIAFGGLLLGAGILLFVAAHWDTLSPAQRFAAVLTLVGLLHAAGALAAARFGVLATALHAVGTICLGAAIFLTGQIFHLQEHWPGGVMLWALGAWVAWALLRDWPQAALAAILTPAWLGGEWLEATRGWAGSETILCAGFLLLAITYLTARREAQATAVQKTLTWIGGLLLIPATVMVIESGIFSHGRGASLPWGYYLLGWAAVLLGSLGSAWWLRGKGAWLNVVAAFWVAFLSATRVRFGADGAGPFNAGDDLAIYGLCALGAIGLIAWGMKEGRRERVNLGIAGFALTILTFYFSTVMDRMGRSASLIGLGLLFLLGGWLLEKTRRRLLAQMGKGAL
ncbi:MAG: DUF2157 domain-containing protein [Deltaproteobacteria bacterium]|nr:DUF2157 domain-containing protein [Deltaproteobacteria bacterium]